MMIHQRMTVAVVALLVASTTTQAFSTLFLKHHTNPSATSAFAIQEKSSDAEGDAAALSRRSLFEKVATSAVVGITAGFLPLEEAEAAEPSKILVLGGSGFVGSRVVKKLQQLGIEVISTSRDGRDGTVAFDVTSPGMDVSATISELSQGCAAVISCIGAIGNQESELKVNAATALAAAGAKANVQRFVYISVAPEVKAFANGIAPLADYMTGKQLSEDGVTSNFPTGYTLIEPTFIHGGDTFGLNPPRVASFYGSFIESLLSSGPVRAITNVAPEGIIKIALEPPVSVDSVANAAVAGALGKTSPVLDTYDKITQAASLI